MRCLLEIARLNQCFVWNCLRFAAISWYFMTNRCLLHLKRKKAKIIKAFTFTIVIYHLILYTHRMSYTLGTSFIDSKVCNIDWLNVVTKSLFYWYLALLFRPGQMEVENNRVNMRKRQVTGKLWTWHCLISSNLVCGRVTWSKVLKSELM